jgi:hypothetical protein
VSTEALVLNIPKPPVFRAVVSAAQFHRNSTVTNQLHEIFPANGGGRAVRFRGVSRFSLNALEARGIVGMYRQNGTDRPFLDRREL